MKDKEDGEEEEEERRETDDEEWRPPVKVTNFYAFIKFCHSLTKLVFTESSKSWSKFLPR